MSLRRRTHLPIRYRFCVAVVRAGRPYLRRMHRPIDRRPADLPTRDGWRKRGDALVWDANLGRKGGPRARMRTAIAARRFGDHVLGKGELQCFEGIDWTRW